MDIFLPTSQDFHIHTIPAYRSNPIENLAFFHNDDIAFINQFYPPPHFFK